ncbi:helix-turn-helix domain-containing protein [Enterococcus sp. HY326]|uniref:helix-turn-helix domain-containing protein n=1 Tax=Enterococcus sp. HY326 TaxID=2971265 RepID=UPI0022409E22|nr:helix-turn-helix transcriptional regulator [Enterococcus sp. HY326]
MENFLGEKLRNYRLEQQLTQKQLADRLFVSDKTISKWESGVGKPDIDTLKNVADLLNLSVDDLLEEREPNFYYEYRSSILLWGLPLLHLVIPNLGELLRYRLLFVNRQLDFKKRSQYLPTAKGIFSAGLISKGIFSVGLLSCGIFSIGIASIGIVAGGVAAVGVLAFSNFAAGIVSFGNFALALLAFGNLAIGYFSLGNFALGFFALGNQSVGPWSYELGPDFGLPEIRQALQSLQTEAIPAFAKTFLIEPLENFFQSSWALQVLVIGFVAVVLLVFIVIVGALITRLLKARHLI